MRAPILDLAARITLRPAEVAEVTGLSDATVKRALSDGSLRSKKWGDARLILVEDLRAYIHSLDYDDRPGGHQGA